MMARRSSPAVHQPSFPLLHGLLVWVAVTLFSPVLQWLLGMIFGAFGRLPPVSTWMRFVAVMAVFGMITGAVTFLAERYGGRWVRSCAFTLFIAAASVPRIDNFAREPLRDFILTSAVAGLITALLMGSIFYALGYPKS
jgi:Na+-translocating ferredoxin:NAD+ oxidoreductase RnfD subunit